MPCLYCYRWVEISSPSAAQSWKAKPKARTGHCTLNPVWIETNGAHFCSHLALNQDRTEGSTLMLAFHERMHENYKQFEREKKERIRLEKVAKDLRAKLKASQQ